jgi:hypothetical protein
MLVQGSSSGYENGDSWRQRDYCRQIRLPEESRLGRWAEFTSAQRLLRYFVAQKVDRRLCHVNAVSKALRCNKITEDLKSFADATNQINSPGHGLFPADAPAMGFHPCAALCLERATVSTCGRARSGASISEELDSIFSLGIGCLY